MSASPAAMAAPASPRAMLRFFAILGGILAAGVFAAYAWNLNGSPPFLKDDAGFIIGRDFFNTWLYGRAALCPFLRP